MRGPTLAALAALAGPAGPALAQDVTILSPTQEAPIRSAPPSGLFGRPGEETGQTALGQDYVVLQRYQRQAGVGNQQVWVEIAPLGPDGMAEEAAAGWAYYGETAEMGSPNFDEGATLAPDLSPGLSIEPEG